MTTFNLGGEGGNSFAFERIGDQVTGQVIDLAEVQQTDIETGEPKSFCNGQPMMMYRVTLATQLRNPSDPTDNGQRSVYLKGSRKAESQSSLAAVLGAVQQATGTTNIATGGTLTLSYIGDGPQANRAFNPPKLYAASYTAPVMALNAVASAPQYAPQMTPAQQFDQQVAQQGPPPQWAVPAPQQQQPQYAQAPAPQYTPPAPAPAPAPAPGQPTPEQVAAVRAAGLDPAVVFPGFAG